MLKKVSTGRPLFYLGKRSCAGDGLYIPLSVQFDQANTDPCVLNLFLEDCRRLRAEVEHGANSPLDRRVKKKKSMYAAIHTSFDEIRRLFFPHWDRSGAWRLEVREELPCFGCCDFEKKTIAIRPLPVGDGLRLLLVHELCHCCAGRSHGEKWRGRMLMAAAAAATAGMHDLAGMLADEVATTGAAGANIRAAAVYAAIRGCADDFTTSSFDEIKGMVCRRLGLCTEEFEKTYRCARRVFEDLCRGRN